MKDDILRQAAWKLLAQEGFSEDFSLNLLKGGKNNRVYKVNSSKTGGMKVVLKEYFKHPADPRDRCTTEFSFLSFAYGRGINCIPKPLQFNPELGLALYEYIKLILLFLKYITYI